MSNLEFKIGLEVEESGIKIEDLEKKVKVFGMAVGVANKDLQAMTKTFKELGEASSKIKLNDNIDSLIKTSNKLQDSLSKTKDEIKKVEKEYNNLKLKEIKIDSSKGDSYLSKFKKDFKDMKIKLSLNAEGFDKLKGYSENIYEMSKAMLALNTATGKFLLSMASFYTVNAAIQGLSEGYKYIFKTAAEFERLQTVLNGLEGSASKGRASFEWIKDFAKETPFTLQETMDAFVRLKSQGLDTNNLKTYGDTAAAMGKTVVQTVEAIMDAVQGENERLKEFGVKGKVIGDKMFYNWSDASGRAKYIIVNNNAKIIESTMTAIFNEKYAGQTDALAKTMNGLVAKIQDSFAIMSNEIMNSSGVFNATKDVLNGMANAMNSVSNNKEKMTELSKTFLDITIVIIELGKVFGDMAITATQVMKQLSDLFTLAGVSVGTFLTTFKNLFEMAYTTLKKIFSDMVIDITDFINFLGMGSLSKSIKKFFGLEDLNKAGTWTIFKEEMKDSAADIGVSFDKMNKASDKFLSNYDPEKGIVFKGAELKDKLEKETDKVLKGLSEGREKIGKNNDRIVETFSDFTQNLKLTAKANEEVMQQTLIPFITLEDALNKSADDINKALNRMPTDLKFTSSVEMVGTYYKPGEDSQQIEKQQQEEAKAKAKAKKESERVRESGLIEYYEIIGNVYQSGYEKMNKYIEGLASNTKLTKAQLEEIRGVLTKNLEVETQITEASNLEKYYTATGEVGKAALEKLRQDLLSVQLQTGLTAEQQLKYKDSLQATYELEKEISSKETLITYYRNVGNEAKAMTLELENELNNLKKSGLYSDQQLADMRLEKEKKLKRDIIEENARKKDELLSQDKDYYIKKGELDIAKQIEFEERRKALLNQDLSIDDMINKEKDLVVELDEKYQSLRENDTYRLQQLQGGFNSYMDDLNVRMNDYASFSKDFMSGMESSLTSSFTTFFDKTSESFLNLKELGKSVFKSLLEQVQQLIVKLLVMQSIKIAMSGFTGGASMFMANGGAFSGGSVQAFATGTVIDTPTYFPLANSKTGLMGEAGPEAIMPLKRDSKGSLGVKVNGDLGQSKGNTVNVHVNNYTNSRIETTTNSDGSISVEVLEDIEKRLAARTAAGTSALDKVNNKKYNMQKQY